MSTATDLEYLITKVSSIQKQLGGPTDTLLENRNKDEFNTIKLKLTETINEVSKKQEERDNAFNKNGRSVAVIRYGVEIQDGFSELNTQLGQMKEALRRQRKNTKKFPESQIEIKQQQLEKYTALVNQLRAREDGETIDSEDKPISLMEMKINLIGNNKQEKKIDVTRELNEIEADALKRFKKNDEELDDMIGQVNIGLDGLKNKAELMGEAIDKQEDAIDGLKVEIDKAHEGLVTSNAKLKKILYQYRRPGKFCVDVLLVLLLLGLIAVIVKIASG